MSDISIGVRAMKLSKYKKWQKSIGNLKSFQIESILINIRSFLHSKWMNANLATQNIRHL